MNHDECNAKMQELEQLFKTDSDTALKSMVDLWGCLLYTSDAADE